jgi:purine nucleoside phosphorylase
MEAVMVKKAFVNWMTEMKKEYLVWINAKGMLEPDTAVGKCVEIAALTVLSKSTVLRIVKNRR